MTDALIIIPARYGSSRYPGKPLAPLKGADGQVKPLIEWTWNQAVCALGANAVIVATDDERISDTVQSFGGQVVMTDSQARNGTERCAAVLKTLDIAPDLVINLQGDAPLVPPHMICDLIAFAQNRQSMMATPFVVCDDDMAYRLRQDAASGRVGGTTVVANSKQQALYFSKHPIPYGNTARLNMHIGLYAYTPEALTHYMAHPPCHAEDKESLEQLRFLDAGMPIDLMETDLPVHGLWELNQPEDVAVMEQMMQRQ